MLAKGKEICANAATIVQVKRGLMVLAPSKRYRLRRQSAHVRIFESERFAEDVTVLEAGVIQDDAKAGHPSKDDRKNTQGNDRQKPPDPARRRKRRNAEKCRHACKRHGKSHNDPSLRQVCLYCTQVAPDDPLSGRTAVG